MPLDTTVHEDTTITRAMQALMSGADMTQSEAGDVINILLNAGFLIRERRTDGG